MPHEAWTTDENSVRQQFVIPNSSSFTYVEAQWKIVEATNRWSGTGASGTRPTNTHTHTPTNTFTPTPKWGTATAVAGHEGIFVWDECTLHQAIRSANPGNVTDLGLCRAGTATGADTITLPQDVTLTGDIEGINSDIRLEGNGFTINGDNKTLPFVVNSGKRLELNNVSVISGYALAKQGYKITVTKG